MSLTRQQLSALNMAKFIKSQSLLLLEKLDALDLDAQSAECEQLHKIAESLFDHLCEALDAAADWKKR